MTAAATPRLRLLLRKGGPGDTLHVRQRKILRHQYRARTS